MAIDDAVSDFETQIANTGYLAAQPASGDEWLLKHWLMEGSSWELHTHTTTTNRRCGNWGGATAGTTAYNILVGIQEQNFLLTNSEYVRVGNFTGGTVNGGYSATKTKD